MQRVDKLKEYDDKKEKELTRDDIAVPEGWLWKEDWKVDGNRAVDDDGETCTTPDPSSCLLGSQ